jgi:hypothetical protein
VNYDAYRRAQRSTHTSGICRRSQYFCSYDLSCSSYWHSQLRITLVTRNVTVIYSDAIVLEGISRAMFIKMCLAIHELKDRGLCLVLPLKMYWTGSVYGLIYSCLDNVLQWWQSCRNYATTINNDRQISVASGSVLEEKQDCLPSGC